MQQAVVDSDHGLTIVELLQTFAAYHKIRLSQYRLVESDLSSFVDQDTRTVAVHHRYLYGRFKINTIWMLLHELGHVLQTQNKTFRATAGVFEWYPTAQQFKSEDVQKIWQDDAVKYNKLPWEHDANLFAISSPFFRHPRWGLTRILIETGVYRPSIKQMFINWWYSVVEDVATFGESIYGRRRRKKS